METRTQREVVAPPRTTIVSVLAIAVVDLAYLAVSLRGEPAASLPEVGGRLLLALTLAVPGVALLRGAEPVRVQRWGPLVGFLASAAFVLVVLGQRGEFRAGYLGFLPAVPLLYALVFPLERWGAAVSGLTLSAFVPLLYRSFELPARFVAESAVSIALATVVAVIGGMAFRRALAGEAAAVGALALSEQERGRGERLAAVGRLADGVAHDVNSPLGSLRSNIQFAQEELRAGRVEPAAEALEDAAACAARIHDIVGALRTVARRGTRRVPCDPSEAARAALRLGALRLPTGVSLDLELVGALPSLPVEREDLVSLLEQMLVTVAEGATGGHLRLIVTHADSSVSFSMENAVARDRTVEPRRSGGGLGLALCEEQGRILGGRVALVQAGDLTRLSLEMPCGTPVPARPG